MSRSIIFALAGMALLAAAPGIASVAAPIATELISPLNLGMNISTSASLLLGAIFVVSAILVTLYVADMRRARYYRDFVSRRTNGRIDDVFHDISNSINFAGFGNRGFHAAPS